MKKDLKLNFRLPTSPTGIVISATLSAVLALAIWTTYSYFFSPSPEIPLEVKAEQYYSQELKKIAEELEKYETYQINIDGDVDTGKDDPFGDF